MNGGSGDEMSSTDSQTLNACDAGPPSRDLRAMDAPFVGLSW